MNQHEPIFFTPPSGPTSGPRRLYKGGGQDNSEMLALQRQQMELQKQLAEAQAQRTPDRNIVEEAAQESARQEAAKAAARDNFYSGIGYYDPGAQAAREAQYQTMSDDIVNFHRQLLDRERDNALKQLGFNLARQGLSGSSQDAYDRGEVERQYLQGVTDINSKASDAVAKSRSGFESAVSRGLQSINAGGDAQTQIASALTEKSTAMQQALEAAKGGSWSDFFSGLASTADTAKINAQRGIVKNAVGAISDRLLGGTGRVTNSGRGGYSYPQ